jgi:hypothetical protein
MCDYSLENLMTRPAEVGDKLVTASFTNSVTRGFAALDNPKAAVCLRAGTEIAFEREIEYDGLLPFLRNRKAGTKLARFRQINNDISSHRDALEFANGKVVLLTKLARGQHAKVLQLPASAQTIEALDGRALTSLVP